MAGFEVATGGRFSSGRRGARELRTLEDLYSVAPGTVMIIDARAAQMLEITLYFVHSRHHRVKVTLPRSEFVTAAGRSSHDVDPYVFVRGDWYDKLHLKRYSVFALIDAIGVKKLLAEGKLTPERLLTLRDSIDKIAGDHAEVAFVSFAENLLLKSDWTIGHYERGVQYTYAPESLLKLLPLIREAFRVGLGLEMYTVMTQGANAYDESSPLHLAPSKNHVSLNTLGLPFAQLMAIDRSASEAIRTACHPPCDLYLDSTVFYSLRLRSGFDRAKLTAYQYASRFAGGETYVCIGVDELLSNLREDEA
jgi:hypothetical protein